ncbi:DUF1990 family protein [Cryobacterium psychrophilum]|uniref:DUF1990 domain-containing protein n=1 Tax=Cryobacterium psychrophilum TaxID=41988 RepID=A0A4Y8KUE7_9MICO|nr:DUF1990 domain-containing protein [Cryobacterium psychrophilum]TDW31532.1 uncharacterized protein (UPF0548 family) [Cryobacterium psychrophilum]TFD79315.1 DUF1990 domain-containing protein [Cryobacterium psychrophilum]
MRRSTFTDAAVTYGAIGGTLAPDLMQYPPKGHRPLERSVRLGSGDERFHVASKLLMTWGVQRGSGMSVTDLENGTGVQYTPVEFEPDGTPIPARQAPEGEATFAEDGTPYIMNGMTAQLEIHVGPMRVKAPVRVVYVIDETARVGFAYGTMKGHPESGEESFIVEKREDDSVWFTLRSFSRPSTWYYRLASPILRVQQERFTRRYLKALHPVGAL